MCCAENGLRRNSVTPASRAAIVRFFARGTAGTRRIELAAIPFERYEPKLAGAGTRLAAVGTGESLLLSPFGGGH